MSTFTTPRIKVSSGQYALLSEIQGGEIDKRGTIYFDTIVLIPSLAILRQQNPGNIEIVDLDSFLNNNLKMYAIMPKTICFPRD